MKDENSIILAYINETVPDVRRDSFLKKYKTCLASGYTSEAAFEGACMATYHPVTVTKEVETVSKLLQRELGAYSKQHKIETTGLLRLRRHIQKLHNTIDAVSDNVRVKVNGQIIEVPKSDFEMSKIKLPAVLNCEHYEATASTERNGELGIRITTFNGR